MFMMGARNHSIIAEQVEPAQGDDVSPGDKNGGIGYFQDTFPIQLAVFPKRYFRKVTVLCFVNI